MLSKVKTKDFPKIRFSEFDDEWVSSKLSDISERITKKNMDNKITETFTNSAVQGIVSQKDFFDKDISNKSNIDKYYVVEPNDFIYNPRISNSAPVGPIRRNNLGRTGIMSPLYFVFRNKYLDDTFLEYFFLSNRWHKHMYKYGNTGARADRFAIKISDLSKMEIKHPSINEQEKISKLFLTLDDLISAQVKQVSNLEQFKQAMLQQMFPQKGKLVPEIRFDGFKEDWNTVRLGDVTKGFDNLRKPVTSSDRIEGTTPYYGANGIQDYIEGYTHDGINILIAEDGANDIINYPIQYTEGKIWVNNHAHVIKSIPELTDSLFLVSRLRATNFYPYLVGSGRYKLNAGVMVNINIQLPSLSEQKLIGEFFQNIDSQITLQKQKVKEYKTLKKGLLQKMFV